MPDQVVILVYGLPGVGKTTVVDNLSSSIRFKRVQIDTVWNSIFDSPSYTKEEATTVFEHLLDKVRRIMTGDISVIVVEGVFASQARIRALEQCCRTSGYSFIRVFLEASDSVVLDRIEQRSIEGEDIPVEMWQKLKRKFATDHLADLTIDTGSLDPADAAANILCMVRR